MGVGAQAGDQLVLSFGGCTVAFESADLGQFQERGTHAACRAMHEGRLAARQMCDPMQHLVRRDVIHHEADSLGHIYLAWCGNQFPPTMA